MTRGIISKSTCAERSKAKPAKLRPCRFTTAGQPAENFYLIISGRARVEDDTGSWDLEAGDMIGEESLADASAASQLGSPADYAQRLLDLLAAHPAPRLALLPVLAALRSRACYRPGRDAAGNRRSDAGADRNAESFAA